MGNKYCKKYPVLAEGRNGSHTWRKMILVREVVEHLICWKPKQDNSSFWFENWTRLGALYFIIPQGEIEEEAEVSDFVLHGGRNKEKLQDNLPDDIVQHIVDNIKPP